MACSGTVKEIRGLGAGEQGESSEGREVMEADQVTDSLEGRHKRRKGADASADAA